MTEAKAPLLGHCVKGRCAGQFTGDGESQRRRCLEFGVSPPNQRGELQRYDFGSKGLDRPGWTRSHLFQRRWHNSSSTHCSEAGSVELGATA